MTLWNPLNMFAANGRRAGSDPMSAFDPSRTGDQPGSREGGPAIGYGETRVDGPAQHVDPRRRPIGFAPPEDWQPEPRFRTELSFKRHHEGPRASSTPEQPGGSSAGALAHPRQSPRCTTNGRGRGVRARRSPTRRSSSRRSRSPRTSRRGRRACRSTSARSASVARPRRPRSPSVDAIGEESRVDRGACRVPAGVELDLSSISDPSETDGSVAEPVESIAAARRPSPRTSRRPRRACRSTSARSASVARVRRPRSPARK